MRLSSSPLENKKSNEITRSIVSALAPFTCLSATDGTRSSASAELEFLHGVRSSPTVVDPRLRHLLPRTDDGRQYHIANDGHVRNASAGWELPRTRHGQGRRDDGWAQCSGMAGVLCGKNSGNAALPS